MRGANIPPAKIDPHEAASLFKFSRLEEMRRAEALLMEFKNSIAPSGADPLGRDLWDVLSLLAFVYDTGRVQGIREERARKHH